MPTEKLTPEETQRKVANRAKRKVNAQAKRLERLKIQYAPLEKFQPNDYNPNRQSEHDFEMLLNSMREDGFTVPILVVDSGNSKFRIVDGEHRWRGAWTLNQEGLEGFDQIPYVLADMSIEQAMISTLRHNKARGSHDIELEADILRDLRELGALDWAIDSLLMDDVEVQRLLDDIPVPEQLAGVEFSQAWVPEQQSEVNDLPKKNMIIGQTNTAADAIRLREDKIRKAKTEEERKMARAETDIYRVSLIYAGDEAEIVKKALGKKPAENFLKLCKNVNRYI